MSPQDNLTTIRRRFYLTFTVIGIVLILVGALYVLGQIWTPISVVLASAFLVFILRTPVAWLHARGIPRALGAAAMYIVALVIIFLILLVFVPVVVEQFIGFVQLLPSYFTQARTFLSDFSQQFAHLFDDSGIPQLFTSLAEEMSNLVSGLASASANFMLITASNVTIGFVVAGVSIVVGFWVLKDLPRISREIMTIIGPKYETDTRVIVGALSRSLNGYLRGMVASCICTGTLSGICYTAIGMPYPVVMALFTGLMVFIPFIGPTLAWIMAGLVGLFISPVTGLLAAGLTIASQVFNDNVIYPRVMSGSVELHPGVILVAIFLGGTLGGVFGMLCAVPLTGAVKTIFVYYFEKRTGRRLLSEQGALFKTSAPSLSTRSHNFFSRFAHRTQGRDQQQDKSQPPNRAQGNRQAKEHRQAEEYSQAEEQHQAVLSVRPPIKRSSQEAASLPSARSSAKRSDTSEASRPSRTRRPSRTHPDTSDQGDL
ncbi:MAG: AI-2E family transporter [Coriobacteriales bacterium]|nr:AI-2E family transporter [Coriobacteriales bacterium]